MRSEVVHRSVAHVSVWMLLACGSPDASDHAAPDATTGAEAGDAGSAGAAGHAGVSGAAPTSGSGGTAGTLSQGGSGGAAGEAVCTPDCVTGERCELVQVMCIRAPCPPVPMCVASTMVSCDPAKILCKRVAPQCPEGQVPSVSGSCYGPCVPVETCECGQASECPNHDKYTCHMSARHCGPYV